MQAAELCFSRALASSRQRKTSELPGSVPLKYNGYRQGLFQSAARGLRSPRGATYSPHWSTAA